MVTTPAIWKAPFQVNTSDGTSDQADGQIVALPDGGFLAVWTDESGVHNPNGSAIVGQRYDFSGEKVGGEVLLSAGPASQDSPSVTVLAGGGVAVAYRESSGDDILVRRFDANLNFVAVDSIKVDGDVASQPRIIANPAGGYAITYTLEFEPDLTGEEPAGPHYVGMMRLVSAAGVVGPEIEVAETRYEDLIFSEGEIVTFFPLDVGFLSNGNVVVLDHVSSNGSDGRYDIAHFTIYDPSGTKVFSDSLPSGFDYEHDLVALEDGFAVTWREVGGGIKVNLYGDSGTFLREVQVSSGDPFRQIEPQIVASPDGGFLVTWFDRVANTTKGRLFDADGDPLLGEFVFGSGRATFLSDGRIALVGTAVDGGDSDIVGAIWDPRTGTVMGTAGDDSLTAIASGGAVYGRGGSDHLVGSAAADVLDGGAGNDRLEGRDGDDVYRVDSAGDIVIELAGEGNDRLYTTVSYVLRAGAEIEQILAADRAATTALNLTGNEFSQSILGNAGANVLRGGGGEDTLRGFEGNDTYYVDSAGDVVIEAVGGGNDRVLTTTGYTLRAGSEIERLEILNRAGTEQIFLTGNAFDQTILGNDGVNAIRGGGGTDVMYGFGGDDVYYVDSASDVVIEAVGGGNDRVFTTARYTLRAGSEIEQLRVQDLASTTAINLTGNAFAQTLLGNAGNNRLDGKGGADTMRGFAGDDTYFVDDAGDVIIEAAGQGNDTVITTVSYALAAGVSIETLRTADGAGTAAIDLTGNAGANRIIGNAGQNVIQGGAGVDIMYAGVDTVRDTFVFASRTDSGGGTDPANWDQIHQFRASAFAGDTSSDLIDLSLIDADTTKPGDQAFRFVTDFTVAGPSEVKGQVRAVKYGSSVNVQVDFDGDATVDMVIRVVNVASLGQADFVL